MADVPDPYGVDVAFTDDGDVVVWPNGRVGTLQGSDNCVQALKLRFRTVSGELPLDPEFGSEFSTHRFIGPKLDQARLLGQARVELQRLVDQDRRFVGAADVQVNEVTNNAQTAQVAFTLALAGGGTIAVSDVQAPTIDDVQDPESGDLADLASVASFDDFDFIAQDDAELEDLSDAADITTIVTDGGVQ